MTAPLALLVELYLSGGWVDITCDVYGRADIQISRGQSDWSSQVQPARCSLTLNNTGATYSPHNPLGPYYGLLGRNIPLRVTVEGHPRFLGEVSEWPLRSEPDVHVPIEASGVLRRLSQSITDEQSPMYRGLLRAVEPLRRPAAYWPCETADHDGILLAAAAGKGVSLVVNASETGLGSQSGFLASKPLITLNDSTVYGDIPEYGNPSDDVLAAAMVKLPEGGVAADNTRIMTVNCAGTAAYWRIRANIDGTLNVQVADPTTDGGGGGVIATSANTPWNIAGRAAYIGLYLTESGGTISWTLFAWPEFAAVQLTATGSLGRTFLKVERLTFGSNLNAGATAIGHIAVWKGDPNIGLPDYLQLVVNGHRGEVAAARAERIAQEEGIVFAPQGSTSNSLPMTQQGVKTGLDLLTDAVAADGGFLYEPPDVIRRTVADGEDGTVGELFPVVSTLVSSATQAHTGTRSVRATWNSGAAWMQATQNYFIVGVGYTFSVWVYIPSGMPHVKLVVDASESGPSTAVDQWQMLTVTWTATSYTHVLKVVPNTTPTAGQQMYVDDVEVIADRAGLHLLPLREVYNQASALTLDYEAAEIALPFEPVDDDRYLINEAAVSVDGQGSPARYSLTAGPLSTQAPPNGAGTYSVGVTRNVLTGYLAYNWAGWLVHQGTWLEPRYPQISVSLGRKRALIPAAATVEPGSIIVGLNPPAWLPPQDIKQVVYGLSETINTTTWKITYNCAPGRPFDVFTVEDDASRLGRVDSRLASSSGLSTSLSVISTAASGRWTTDSAQFPLGIRVAPKDGMVGEEMTVTNITGAGLTQTFTVARGTNGIVVDWPSGSVVTLARRPTLAL